MNIDIRVNGSKQKGNAVTVNGMPIHCFVRRYRHLGKEILSTAYPRIRDAFYNAYNNEEYSAEDEKTRRLFGFQHYLEIESRVKENLLKKRENEADFLWTLKREAAEKKDSKAGRNEKAFRTFSIGAKGVDDGMKKEGLTHFEEDPETTEFYQMMAEAVMDMTFGSDYTADEMKANTNIDAAIELLDTVFAMNYYFYPQFGMPTASSLRRRIAELSRGGFNTFSSPSLNEKGNENIKNGTKFMQEHMKKYLSYSEETRLDTECFLLVTLRKYI